ncbi:MAG: nicotinate (nicotinamide) nucleotide adenylyltransferase [Ruminococcus sp.]|nr:nicotinate (nicotinamide) nucleotide adenylyltransferase [Ruminococcus sp.]
MRIGIYGGSFNPVHNGHIHLARAAADEFSLDRVYLVPSRISPHRSMSEYVSGEERLAMLRLACRCDERLSVSDFELSTDRVSYTVYTVEHFREKYPDAELFLLVGSDMLMCFESWYNYRDILAETNLCVVSRYDGDRGELEKMAEKLSEYGRVFISRSEPLELSSTEIRKKIAKNENYACYLDENVVQYIRSKGLYHAASVIPSEQ